MKKVLFLSLSPHTTLGGTQNYNYKLMQIFKELNWDITEYNCNLGIDNVIRTKLSNVKIIDNSSVLQESNSRFLEGRRFMKQVKTSNREIPSIVDKGFDLIIDARQHPYTWDKKWGKKSLATRDNVIWIQHFCIGLYDGECISKNKIEKFFIYLYTNRMSKKRYNVLYSHKNIVLFDKYNKSSLDEKRFIQSPNITLINLSSFDKAYIRSNLTKINSPRDIDFLYVGRINQTQKNAKFINKVFSYGNKKLFVVGSGEKKYVELLKKNKNINYIGPKQKDELFDFYRRAKFLFIPSKYEGFPYSIVEAISHGCIPIVLDTYESVKFFDGVAKIFDKKIKAKEMNDQLNNCLISYDIKEVKNAINFALANLSNEEFQAKWKKLIQSFK